MLIVTLFKLFDKDFSGKGEILTFQTDDEAPVMYQNLCWALGISYLTESIKQILRSNYHHHSLMKRMFKENKQPIQIYTEYS